MNLREILEELCGEVEKVREHGSSYYRVIYKDWEIKIGYTRSLEGDYVLYLREFGKQTPVCDFAGVGNPKALVRWLLNKAVEDFESRKKESHEF